MTCLVTAAVIFSQQPMIQMTSLMHHSSTPITGMRNPNQCSTLCLKCQFTPPCLLICMGCYNHIYMLGNNGHTRCASTPTWVKTFYSITVVTCMSVYCTDLHVCRCSKIFKVILIINTTDNYGHVRWDSSRDFGVLVSYMWAEVSIH